MNEPVRVLQVGEKVPDFRMDVYDPVSRDFAEFNLARGKDAKWLVLFFYPADFTFVCPTELADVAEKHEQIKSLGGEVVSVSTDTKFVHMAWQREEKLLEKVKYLMGSDPTKALSRMFGVLDEKSGLSLRGTFIIDANGTLVSSEVNFFNVGRNADELVRKLECNSYLAGHPEEACPAKWTKGHKTLKPSAKLVGKVHEALK